MFTLVACESKEKSILWNFCEAHKFLTVCLLSKKSEIKESSRGLTCIPVSHVDSIKPLLSMILESSLLRVKFTIISYIKEIYVGLVLVHDPGRHRRLLTWLFIDANP